MSRTPGRFHCILGLCLLLACALTAAPLAPAASSRSKKTSSTKSSKTTPKKTTSRRPSASSSRATSAAPVTFDAWTAAAQSAETSQHESWSVVIEDLATTETIFEFHGSNRLVPASNRKIITFGMALENLGPDYQFQTEFGLSAPCETGRPHFHGDVILRSAGDPSLTEPFLQGGRNPAEIFRTWARTLKETGIRYIYGNLVVDASAFGDSQNAYPEEVWGPNHHNQTYAPIPAALALCQNLMRITASPASKTGAPCRISIFPADEGITVINNTRTSSRVRGLSASFDENSKALELSGSVPSGRVEVATIPIPHPLHYVGQLLQSAIAAEEIRLTGHLDIRTSGSAAAPQLVQRMGAHESPPLAQMLFLMMRESNNFLAEQLWRAAAARAKGVGDLTRAREAEQDWYRRHNLPWIEPGWDGSGLSRKDLVSARDLAAISRALFNTAWQELFLTVLPTAGESGTLRHRSTSLMGGRVTAKTGTLAGVSSLTGFIRDEHDRPRFVFSAIGNAPRDTNGRLAKRINDLMNVAIRKLDEDIAAGRRPADGPARPSGAPMVQYVFKKSSLGSGSAEYLGADAGLMQAERELPEPVAAGDAPTTLTNPALAIPIGQ